MGYSVEGCQELAADFPEGGTEGGDLFPAPSNIGDSSPAARLRFPEQEAYCVCLLFGMKYLV